MLQQRLYLYNVQRKVDGDWYNLNSFPVPYQLADERMSFYQRNFDPSNYRIQPIS